MLDTFTHQAYRVAQKYIDALAIGAYERAAALVRAADLAAFQELTLASLETLLAAHGDDDGFQERLGGSAVELGQLEPAAFFARFMTAVVPPGAIAAARPQLTIGRIDDAEAELRFRIGEDAGRPVRLVREEARWSIVLHEELGRLRARVSEDARRFQQRRAEDRATFTDADDLFPVRVDDEWGFIDRGGVLRIVPRFGRAGDFAAGHAPVKVRSRWGYIDGGGQLVIRPQFDGASELRGGFAVVRRDDEDDKRFGVIDTSGRVRLPLEHTQVSLIEQTALALGERDGRWTLINLLKGTVLVADADSTLEAVLEWSQGKLVVDEAGEQLICMRAQPVPSQLSHELADSKLVRFIHAGLFGFMSAQGKVVIRPRFELALPFAQGLAAAMSRGKWGFIDDQGRWVIEPEYFEADGFAHGIAPVAQDGLTWGYVDRTGKRVTDFAFASAGRATRGVARITRSFLGGPGYLRPDGSMLWEPRDED